MAATSILKRGFKAKAERISLEYRKKLALYEYSPLCAFNLAEFMSIPVFKATEFLTSKSDIEKLKGLNGNNCGWSALTMQAKSGATIIVYNPFHSDPRQQSDIMHELSHVICGHSFNGPELGFTIPMGMRNFNEVHEEEAKCLGSTLQISRDGLLQGMKKNMSEEQLAAYFNASVEMVKYRQRMTGVARQLSYNS